MRSLVALLVVPLLALPAHASPFDRPCTVTPPTVNVGDTYTITDSGLKEQGTEGTQFLIEEFYPSGIRETRVFSDGRGNISATETALEAGSIPVEIYNLGYYGPKHGYRDAGDCSFTVS
jgi:hypothetical protein